VLPKEHPQPVLSRSHRLGAEISGKEFTPAVAEVSGLNPRELSQKSLHPSSISQNFGSHQSEH
jgi:hypothetical protein